MKRNEFIRVSALCILWTLAAAFLICEGEDVVGVLAVKVLGILVGVASWMLGRYWMGEGCLPWTERMLDE